MRAAVAIAVLAATAVSCGNSVETASTTGSGGAGGNHPEAKTWCSALYGVVRTPKAAPYASGVMCKAGEICAEYEDVDEFECCKGNIGCGNRGGGEAPEPGYFCDRSYGWVQNPLIEGNGVACGPGQTCAQHNDKNCGYVCCDVATDPDCGVPYSRDCAHGE